MRRSSVQPVKLSSRDREVMALALRLAAKGRGLQSQSHGRRGGREPRRDHRTGLSPQGRWSACRSACLKSGRFTRQGGTSTSPSRTLQSSQKRTPPCVYRWSFPPAFGASSSPWWTRIPQVQERIAQLKRAGIQVEVGCLEPERDSSTDVYPLGADRPAIHDSESRHDVGWSDRHRHRRISMDYR